MVQPRVELGAPERSTAAGNLSGDGHAVDIAYEPPAVDCLRAVWWSCTASERCLRHNGRRLWWTDNGQRLWWTDNGQRLWRTARAYRCRSWTRARRQRRLGSPPNPAYPAIAYDATVSVYTRAICAMVNDAHSRLDKGPAAGCLADA